MNLALKKSERSKRVTPGHLSSGVLAFWIRRNKLLTMGAPAGYVRFVRFFKSEVCVYHQPSQVQLMTGEFLETALYWAGVVSVRLGAIAEKKVSQHSCVWGSAWV